MLFHGADLALDVLIDLLDQGVKARVRTCAQTHRRCSAEGMAVSDSGLIVTHFLQYVYDDAFASRLVEEIRIVEAGTAAEQSLSVDDFLPFGVWSILEYSGDDIVMIIRPEQALDPKSWISITGLDDDSRVRRCLSI